MPAPEITKTREIAICGNPNCGKTTIFNAITGLAQQVGNYPGVTVERIRGQFAHGGRRYVLADIPGTYSLSAFSPDEYIACAALTGSLDASPAPDAIICVLDGTQLERGLYFLLQVLEIGRPTVAAVNMVDIAAKRGLTIDYAALERLTGVPVVPVVGSRGEGIARLVALAAQAADAPPLPPRRRYRAEVENLIERLQATPGNGHRSRAEYLRIVFDADGPVERRFLAAAGGAGRALLERGRSLIRERAGTLAAAETAPLTEAAAELYRQAVRAAASPRPSRSGRIDRFLLHPVLGPIVLVTAMMFTWRAEAQKEFMAAWALGGEPAAPPGLWRHVHPPMLPESRPDPGHFCPPNSRDKDDNPWTPRCNPRSMPRRRSSRS
ncbi:MAG TPA: FeoB small GTPase domain-containing protein, partial [candidate division Zixibacteria bacterium]|nr:FeoB small GTPase domain-containing protein [candidate division Zixibacteria bacterium]